ncbi:amidase [Corticibacter populi]|uniref:Amidase n=1 Tax=Corticibacter populi TaxID=1550736 RepID=A0A3M6QP30_9BURK|nr:amidase [Corticibacter populi]RMX04152.1 amidase [Corticibacter populi]RZS33170.1 amidase [Corticibacter populi]
MTQADSNAFCFIPYPAPSETLQKAPAAGGGPLAGLDFAVKDIYDVAGYPSGWGNPHALALSGIKTQSAPVVQALQAAGARVTGKVITDELAFSMNGKNAHFGTPRNGAAPDRIPGGSSSGSASAVSNGLCDFAIGSDTGGSVRCPASHCGLIGLRPTHGRISLAGCMPLAPGFDTCGWFARDMAVFARVGEVLLGEDRQPLPAAPRLLLAADILASLDTQVQAAVQGVLAQLVRKPDAQGGEGEGGVGWTKPQPVDAWLMPSIDLYWAFRIIQGWEAWRSQGGMIERYGLQLGPGVRDRFAWSKDITAEQVAPQLALRQAFTERLEALLGRDGVLLMPTMPQVAPLLSQSETELEDYRNQAIHMLCLSGLAGLPQISLPLMRIEGVPLGFSLLGPRGSDQSLIALAARIMAGVARPAG